MDRKRLEIIPLFIPANPRILKIGTNWRKYLKKRDIPEFPIHYCIKIYAKRGTNDKITHFFAS